MEVRINLSRLRINCTTNLPNLRRKIDNFNAALKRAQDKINGSNDVRIEPYVKLLERNLLEITTDLRESVPDWHLENRERLYSSFTAMVEICREHQITLTNNFAINFYQLDAGLAPSEDETVDIETGSETQLEEKPSGVAYYLKEVEDGVKGCVMGYADIIFHPVTTVTNLGTAILHPGQTLKAIGNEMYEHPVRFAANIVTGSAISAGIGKLGQAGYSKYIKKAADTTQKANKVTLVRIPLPPALDMSPACAVASCASMHSTVLSLSAEQMAQAAQVVNTASSISTQEQKLSQAELLSKYGLSKEIRSEHIKEPDNLNDEVFKALLSGETEAELPINGNGLEIEDPEFLALLEEDADDKNDRPLNHKQL